MSSAGTADDRRLEGVGLAPLGDAGSRSSQGRQSSCKTRLKWLVAIAVLATLIKAFQHYAGEVTRLVASVDVPLFAAGLALCIAYRILNSSGWVMVLRAMHQPMPLRRGMRLWLLAESMRWLPGSVWGFCTRVYQATRNGVPPTVAAASLPLELLLTILAWSIVASLGLVCSGSRVDWLGLIHPRMLLIGSVGVVVAGLMVGFWMACFPQSRLGKKLQALRNPLVALRSVALNRRMLALVVLLYTCLCCLNGFAFYLILRSVSATPVDPVAVIGINACGWLIGFLAIGAPGGIGVREAGAAFLLSSMMPLPAAIAASVLWRIVMIFDEIICLGLCLAPNLITQIAWKPRIALDAAS